MSPPFLGPKYGTVGPKHKKNTTPPPPKTTMQKTASRVGRGGGGLWLEPPPVVGGPHSCRVAGGGCGGGCVVLVVRCLGGGRAPSKHKFFPLWGVGGCSGGCFGCVGGLWLAVVGGGGNEKPKNQTKQHNTKPIRRPKASAALGEDPLTLGDKFPSTEEPSSIFLPATVRMSPRFFLVCFFFRLGARSPVSLC